MKPMLAYCGLVCDSCSIHLATLEQNESRKHTMRETIAEECSKHYGMNLQPGDINDCDGCRSNTGRIFFGCRSCAIRKCAMAQNISSCAFCIEYECDELKKMFTLDTAAKTRLEEIRQANP